MRVNSEGKFEEKYSFLKTLSLTSRGEAVNPKMGQKGRNGYFSVFNSEYISHLVLVCMDTASGGDKRESSTTNKNTFV